MIPSSPVAFVGFIFLIIFRTLCGEVFSVLGVGMLSDVKLVYSSLTSLSVAWFVKSLIISWVCEYLSAMMFALLSGVS